MRNSPRSSRRTRREERAKIYLPFGVFFDLLKHTNSCAPQETLPCSGINRIRLKPVLNCQSITQHTLKNRIAAEFGIKCRIHVILINLRSIRSGIKRDFMPFALFLCVFVHTSLGAFAQSAHPNSSFLIPNSSFNIEREARPPPVPRYILRRPARVRSVRVPCVRRHRMTRHRAGRRSGIRG